MTLDSFIQPLLEADPLIILAALAAASLLEYVFPPFPGDTVVLFGAYLAGRGTVGVVPVFAVVTAGSVLGALALYLAARRGGRPLLKRLRWLPLDDERLARMERWYSRWGPGIIAVNRFVPAFRALFFLAAGLLNLRMVVVVLAGLASAVVWNALILAVGFHVGENWDRLEHILQTYNRGALTVAALAVAVWLAVRFTRRRAAERAAGRR